MVVEALKKLGDGGESMQVGGKRKCECDFSHHMVAEKRLDTPLMTINSGSEPSKVPGITKGSSKKASGRDNKDQTQEQATIKIGRAHV